MGPPKPFTALLGALAVPSSNSFSSGDKNINFSSWSTLRFLIEKHRQGKCHLLVEILQPCSQLTQDKSWQAPALVKNVKKSLLEQERDSFIPRKSKNARAGREGRDLAQDLLPGSEGKAQTLPGFVPSEAPQLPAERRFWIFYFIFFFKLHPGFSQCGAALGAFPASPTSLWISCTEGSALPGSAPAAASRGILKWRFIPTPVNRFCSFLLHCHKILYIWNNSTPAPLSHRFFSDWSSFWFYHLLLRGFYSLSLLSVARFRFYLYISAPNL